MRVKVQDLEILNKGIRNRKGTVIEHKEIFPPFGPPYIMYTVKLDKPAELGSGIVKDELFLPASCFEVIQ